MVDEMDGRETGWDEGGRFGALGVLGVGREQDGLGRGRGGVG